MAIWKAKIVSKGNLDTNGTFEITYNIIRPNGQLLVLGGTPVERRTSGLPTTITTNITQDVTRIAQEVIESTRLQIGDEISVDV